MDQPVIERHAYWRLKDPSERDRVVEEALRALPRVPGVRAVRVGTPADRASEVWDVAVTVTFAREEDVASYLADPLHRAFVTDVLEPRLEVRKAWNFRVRAS